MACWLFKSEPDAYGIDDLSRDRIEPWTGIRNYQVRNMIRDDMKVGDEVIFYHSSCKEPGAVGLARISGSARPDPLQFDPASPYFDGKSSKDDPRWLAIDIEFVRKFDRIVTLAEMKQHPGLADFTLNRRGSRLSIFPVNSKQRDIVLMLEQT